MSAIDDNVIAAHDALNACGLGAAAEAILVHVPGPHQDAAMCRAWDALTDVRTWSTLRDRAAFALRAVEDEMRPKTIPSAGCSETHDPVVGMGGAS